MRLRREIDGLLQARYATGVLDAGPHRSESMTLPASLRQGTCIGVWYIGQLFGCGGMGEVYAGTRIDAAFR